MRLLSNLLRRFIRVGTLRVRDADGKAHVFGNRLPGPDVAIHLRDRKLYTRLFLNPELYAAEAYMDGTLTLEDGAHITTSCCYFRSIALGFIRTARRS